MARHPGLARRLREAGQLPPEAIPPPPTAHPEVDQFYMRAFSDLSTCRSYGMDIGPIPWLAIDRYAERAGLDRDAATAFVDVIRALDAKYLEIRDAERPEPS